MIERAYLPTRNTTASSFTPIRHPLLQRTCSCGSGTGSGGCKECEEQHGLQRHSDGWSEPQQIPPIVHDALRSSGQPLDASTRSFMESRFGHDFGSVRVHSGELAGESARSVNALAYTRGHNVVFGHGQYAPETTAGRRLLAHELTHVLQQAASPNGLGNDISHPADPLEREAADVAEHVLQSPGKRVPSRHASGPGLQRQIAEEEDATPAPVENEEEGIEIDPKELMAFPRWMVTMLPGDEYGSAGSFAPVGVPPGPAPLQRQAMHCDKPSAMRKVTSGTFEGGKTLDDYFPDIVGGGFWGTNNKAGPFDNGTRAGSSVQLIGELPIPCATSHSPTTLGQTITWKRLKVDGKKLRENGKDIEGQTMDDVKRSGRDQSKAPFRQIWTGAVTMADPISGAPYAGTNSYELEADLTTSLTGAGGTVSVGWGVTVEAAKGKVTKNEVR
jgi:hypothetical protein